MAGIRTVTDYESVNEAYEAQTLAFWGHEFDVDPTWTLEAAFLLSGRLDSFQVHRVANVLASRCCGGHEELVSINGEIWLLIFSYGH